jgi:hypothetical protein
MMCAEVDGESDWRIVLRARESRVHGEGASRVTQPAKGNHEPGVKEWINSCKPDSRGIANKATTDKTHRFRNLFGPLTVDILWWCWRFVNLRAAPGIDRVTARQYGANLLANLRELAETVKAGRYRAK